jgi:hypothetical protein
MPPTSVVIKTMASEHKLGTAPDLACSERPLQRFIAMLRPPAALLALALGMVAAAHAQHGETAITCANAVSGAPWQIRIDYDRSTVDSNPARISSTEITWKGAKDGWNYTLDRKSGNLTIIIASATGGNFLYHRCKLEN